jgi:hypothetical protein
MKARDQVRAAAFEAALIAHSGNRRALPGIDDAVVRAVLVRQMIDSLHRVRYPVVVAARPVSARRADPGDPEYFDPVRSAVFHLRQGDVDEACWLVFLFVHFGKHMRGGYRYARDVYGRLGQGGRWDWPTLSGDVPEFVAWLVAHHDEIRSEGGPGGFGSHRKYESLKPDHTGRTVASYVAWVDPTRGHQGLFDEALEAAGGSGGAAFNRLYASMDAVSRFGRTARFDYLTMIGKLGIAPIAPTSVHLAGATGPRAGARLLCGVGAETSGATLEDWLRELDADLQVGPQVLEDALCNWQKAPDSYRAFRG